MSRYCPNCNREVCTHLTGGQILLMIFLFMLGILPGVLYACFHARKCPSCGTSTLKDSPTITPNVEQKEDKK